MRVHRIFSPFIILALIALAVAPPSLSQAAETSTPLLEAIRTEGSEDVIEVIIENESLDSSTGTVNADISIKALKRIAYELTFDVEGTSFKELEGIGFFPLYPQNTYKMGRISFPPGSSLIIKQDKWGSGGLVTIGKMVVVNAAAVVLALIGIKPASEFEISSFSMDIAQALSVIPFGDFTLIATHKLVTDMQEGASFVTIAEDLVDVFEEFPGVAEAVAGILVLFGISASATTVAAWITAISLAVFGIPRVVAALWDWAFAPSHVETTIQIRETGMPVDVFFLVDLSGSFYDDLPLFKAQAPGIITDLKTTTANIRFGLGKFEDYPIYPFGDLGSGDQAYQRIVDLTFNEEEVLTAIDGLFTRYGYDDPESQLPALYQAATGVGQDLSSLGYPEASIPADQQANFRDGASKLFLLWTDAPFHYPGDPGNIPYPGPSFEETIDAILALDPPKVVGVTSGGGGQADLEAVATATEAYAPLEGVDCDGDGFIDIPGGAPLVCGIAATGEGIGDAIVSITNAALHSPMANANGPYVGGIGEAIQFDGSGSFDTDGSIVLYEWDFDGDLVFDFTSDNPNAQHTYTETYFGSVTLRVTDNDGLTGSAMTGVAVQNVSDMNIALSANIEPIPVGGLLIYQITVTNQGTDDASSVVLTSVLLAELNIEKVVTDQGECNFSPTALACDLGAVDIGDQVSVTVTASPMPSVPVAISAFVEDAENFDFDSTDNLAQLTSTPYYALFIPVIQSSPGG